MYICAEWISKCVECNAMDSASNKLAIAIRFVKAAITFPCVDIVTKFTSMAAVMTFATDSLSVCAS